MTEANFGLQLSIRLLELDVHHILVVLAITFLARALWAVRGGTGSVKKEQVVEFLKALKAHLKQPLFWDGARPHRAAMVREYLDSLEGHNHMTFLPPDCPELNPVECLWAWLKRHAIANFCPDNLNELQTTARNKLKSAQLCPRSSPRAGFRQRCGDVMIDLAKHVFQLHGADRRGRPLHRAKVSRGSLLEAVRTLKPGMVVMEACSTAHHWARRFHSLGIEVRLISPQYVSPFVKTNKNDRNDAEAIVEAASRPAMRFVAVKSVEQQDIQAAHRMRAILIRHRTAMINQIRGLLGERGLTISRSPEAFKRAIPELLSKSADELTSFCQTLLTELLQHLQAIEERVHLIEASIQSFMKQSVLCKKIAQVPGIGPITATAMVAAVGDAKQFRNGRHLAAWLGLVPRQYSSGGKPRLHGISRRGDTYLRTLLIHGARAVLRYSTTKTDPQSVWLQQLIARRGHNCAAVALANKNARVIQALLSSDSTYLTHAAAA